MGKIGKIDLGQQIKKIFHSSKEFMLDMGNYVYEDGMFIPTAREIEEGSIIHFNFTLQDRKSILRGTGKVQSISRKPPLGWKILFVELDERSKKNLQMIIDWKRKHGQS